ncbi:unnamed protein product [Pieris brassicae]|uniref:Uncharacterized protein n=1 Tax=Pieris brassicae TaxID=7116 RepID=A0A9P0XJ98_PIEBR|nr:unnamed protein product [Pieris brassicae]
MAFLGAAITTADFNAVSSDEIVTRNRNSLRPVLENGGRTYQAVLMFLRILTLLTTTQRLISKHFEYQEEPPEELQPSRPLKVPVKWLHPTVCSRAVVCK